MEIEGDRHVILDVRMPEVGGGDRLKDGEGIEIPGVGGVRRGHGEREVRKRGCGSARTSDTMKEIEGEEFVRHT